MDRGIVSMLPMISTMPAPNIKQGSQTGEEGAFQLLLESLLFETLAGQVFQGGKGLLAGIDLGPDTGDPSGQEEPKGQELLALLELLQVPLMEHFRSVLPKDDGLLPGNLPGNQPSPQALLMNRGNQTGHAAGSGEPSGEPTALRAEPGFLSRVAALAGMEEPLSHQPPNGEVLAVINGQSEQSGELAGLDGQEAVMLHRWSREAGAGEQVVPSLPGREESRTGYAVNPSRTTVTEQQLWPWGPGQAAENQETAFTSNRTEGAVQRGLTWPELADQMLQSGKLKLLAAKQEIELQLKPEYLGKLAIRLTLENGAMTAKFVVESYQVSKMLEQNLPQLRQTLADQGIRFDQAQVEVGDPGSFAQDRQPQWQQGGAYREPMAFPGVEALEHRAREEDYLEAVPSTGIDYRA